MPPRAVVNQEVELDKYKVETQFSPTGYIYLLGKRGKGKTTFCEYLLMQDPYIHESITVVLAGFPKSAAHWRNIIPPLLVLGPEKMEDEATRDEEFATFAIRHLRTVMNEMNRQVARHEGKTFPVYRRLNLIMDDIALYHEIMADSIMKEIAGGSRQTETRIIVIGQELHQAVRGARKGFDQVMCCGFFDEDQTRDLHKEYGKFMEKRQFQAALATTTRQEHSDLFIIDVNVQKCFKLERPTLPLQHKPFCHPCCWSFSDERYISINDQRKLRAKESKHNTETIQTWRDDRGTIVVKTRT